MDRDETSIGGLKNPALPTRQLFYVTILMDITAILLSLLISKICAACVLAYILASRAYSYRGIRLKKYAIPGYLTVVVFQGAVIFFVVYTGSHQNTVLSAPAAAMLASSLLVGGFYPLTQVYQHEADRKDGVMTLSRILGYKGTFIFTIIVYSLAFATLAYYFFSSLETEEFWILATCMLPILVYFLNWMRKVWKHTREANFENTMRMNWLASCCTNIGFIVVLLMQ